MKTLKKLLVLFVPILFLLNGCGGGGSSSTQTTNPNLKEVTVAINLPSSVSTKPSEGFQKTSTVSNIDKMTIDVKDSLGNSVYVAKQMSLQNGKWSVTLLVDATKAPFSFTVRAYEGTVKRYEGTLNNISSSDLSTQLVVPISRVISDGDTIPIPSVTNIEISSLLDGGVSLHFLVTNPTKEKLEYNLTTPNLPASCTKNFFSPSQGDIAGTASGFYTTYTLDTNQSCNLNTHQLTLTNTVTKNAISLLFSVNSNLGGVSINFAPQIDAFNVTTQGDNVTFNVTASDPEGDNVSYFWGTSEGNITKISPRSSGTEWIIKRNDNKLVRIGLGLKDEHNATALYFVELQRDKQPTITLVSSTTTVKPFTQRKLYPGVYEGMFSNARAFAALRSDGSVVTWGLGGGDSSSVKSELNHIQAIYSSEGAFAALRKDGSVITWGDLINGGDSSSVKSELTNVQAIYSTSSAFAALKSNGSVITWGDSSNGGDSSSVKSKLTNVQAIYSTHDAFAALKNDGTVVTWGDSGNGGDSSSVKSELKNVQAIYSSNGAFAALKSDKSVIIWGNPVYGADESDSIHLTNVKTIYSTYNAFAALKYDNSVETWEYSTNIGTNLGHPIPKVQFFTNVDKIYTTQYAFAALKKDGSVETWGDQISAGTVPITELYGGNSSAVQTKLKNVKIIYSTDRAFAALKSDGTVVTWGYADAGGDSSDVTLTNVKAIYSTSKAFAALKNDGSVVPWGSLDHGGNSSSVQNQLTNVQNIYSIGSAFAALKSDGSVVTWGDANYGGDSSSVKTKLHDVVGFAPSF